MYLYKSTDQQLQYLNLPVNSLMIKSTYTNFYFLTVKNHLITAIKIKTGKYELIGTD